MIKGKIKMGRKSEEWCSHCGEVFKTKYLKTICPSCGKIVISCNNCIIPLKGNCGNRIITLKGNCRNCTKGNNFKEY